MLFFLLIFFTDANFHRKQSKLQKRSTLSDGLKSLTKSFSLPSAKNDKHTALIAKFFKYKEMKNQTFIAIDNMFLNELKTKTNDQKFISDHIAKIASYVEFFLLFF